MTPKERRRILEQAREDPPTAHIRYDDWMAAHGRTPERDRKAICEYLDREEKHNPHSPEYLACLRELRQEVGNWTDHGLIAATLETLEKFGPCACFSDEQLRRLELNLVGCPGAGGRAPSCRRRTKLPASPLAAADSTP
jgi:hypothetical protein